jgi:hypothetical protein
VAKQPKSWVVDFDADAVLDFEDVKSRGDRKAVFNVVQKLKDVGPELPSPHMKSLKGRSDLFELRPRQGGMRGPADLREARAAVHRSRGRGEEEGLRSSGSSRE